MRKKRKKRKADPVRTRSSPGFYHREENARRYIEMRKGLNGRYLIEILQLYLKPGARVLELGMGPGTDLDILKETFRTTGSDYSRAFLDIYREKDPPADLILLDAATLLTERKFDCIFSNKVLHHLSKPDLKESFLKQRHLLNPDGILFHTFWRGEEENRFRDLTFTKYLNEELKKLVEKLYRIVKMENYSEMNLNDSVFLILKKI